MITFEDRGTNVVLVYASDQGPVTWVDDKLRAEGAATLSRTFTVRPKDLLPLDVDEDARAFVIGEVMGDYRVIRPDVLGLKHGLRIAKSIGLSRAVFVAERNISIFGRLDDLVTEPIIVGGNDEDAIPEDEFARLLHDFPTSTELTHYAASRIARVLNDYLETMSDADRRLTDYMDRRRSQSRSRTEAALVRVLAAGELELEKFTYVRDQLAEMLQDAESYSEAAWQEAVADLFLLVFPQYVAVLRNVQVKEQYSKPGKTTNRYIDLLLVGANGCVDVIEIKKPFSRGLLSRRRYRDNYIPVRELSGSIMQAEKYLFYLSKAGRVGEEAITEKYASALPDGLGVRVSNPKAIILSGRDHNLDDEETRDLEFARRMYSNLVDIISYDDLLRRLDNVIAALMKRSGGTSSPAPDAEVEHE